MMAKAKALAALGMALLACGAVRGAELRAVKLAEVASTNRFCTGNRAPLKAGTFVRLPIGSIVPRGWLRRQLELDAAGECGHLAEVSKFLKFEGNGWSDPKGKGGWEELPYWLKGYGDLGYVLGDERIIGDARKWIDAILATQEESGWFGPQGLKTSLKGRADMWPHMLILNVLQSWYEFNGDPRVIPFMTKYCRWQNSLPADSFGQGYWPKVRFGDGLESVYWLYNRTGDAWLLDLALKIHENMARWDEKIINWHNVNVAQGFREPAIYWMQSGEAKYLNGAERNYQEVMTTYGQFPGGGFAGSENARKGFDDPRQGIETCGIVEFMHSFEMLTRISGNPVWADRCEEIAFNSLPAAMDPEHKGLHYVTCANVVQMDHRNQRIFPDGWCRMYYSPWDYRCCQHNHGMGWPYYAEEMWLATADGGLCASLYAASEVSAAVGDGTKVKIVEETDYPFGETIALRVSTPKAVAFPLWLRIPRWCAGAAVRINGAAETLRAEAPGYAVIERTWKDGDSVALELPMRVAVRRWAKNKDSASVDYGPLSFSLKIDEQWTRSGGKDPWPEWDVAAASPWNYGLVLPAEAPEKAFKVTRKTGPLAAQPFTAADVPIRLEAQARRIPGWTTNELGAIAVLPASPVASAEAVEAVQLIPMGAARLRISSFPVVKE